MPRYAIWDKRSDFVTPGKDAQGRQVWAAMDYLREHAPWAIADDVKVVVSGGRPNGALFMDYDQLVESARAAGCVIPQGTDREVLDAIEAFESRAAAPTVDPMERVAAALELNNLMNM